MLTDMNQDLFADHYQSRAEVLSIGPGAVFLAGFVLESAAALLAEVERLVVQAPFRHLSTPGGQRMSVAMSNCGSLGWVSDRAGYRYQATDPLSGQHWPAMPALLLTLAESAASAAGYKHFQPNVCLINRYEAGARMGLHQDKDERNLSAPIVSFSLGLPATFIWGGLARGGTTRRFVLNHGDALVWGGEDRLRFHGVAPLKPGLHPMTGACRINITFRQTG